LSHEGAEIASAPFLLPFWDLPMTEITRVPLQPIARGSLTKLWLGVLIAVLFAAWAAWAAMPPQVRIETITPGRGPSPTLTDVALINYKGTLADGKVFDEARSAVFPLQGVIPGFTKALTQMQKGGRYKVWIPAKLGYGDKPAGEIPPNSDLNFEIEMLDFISGQEYQQRMQMMQQMQQMQQQPGAAPPPGAAAPAP
jgi:FKBP-type peptidyl-prolyl cis-trans isomerase FkpA